MDTATTPTPPPPKLLDRMRDLMRRRHYALATEESYVNWSRRYILFHNKRHPLEMGEAEIREFLTHLAVEGRVAASTQNQALNAILFFYSQVLEKPLGDLAPAVSRCHPDLAGGTSVLGGTGFQPVRGESITRRNLPHIQHPGDSYHVIFRTMQLLLPEPARRIALDACLYWDGRKAEVYACVVMPDHVHLLLTPRTTGSVSVSLSEILHSVKSYSSNRINELLGRSGSLWQDESFDRYIRSESDFEEKYEYIRNNPVRAGLVATWDEYEFLYLQGAAAGSRCHSEVLGGTDVLSGTDVLGGTGFQPVRSEAGSCDDVV